MKKCKYCGCVICRGASKVIITTGKLFKRKRDFFHLACYFENRKQERSDRT